MSDTLNVTNPVNHATLAKVTATHCCVSQNLVLSAMRMLAPRCPVGTYLRYN